MGMKPRRKRCFCCERLMPQSDLIRLNHYHWGEVLVCADAEECCHAADHN
jgi:hypothetical protein